VYDVEIFKPKYILPFTFTFYIQFKLMHRILPVNSFPYKRGLKETELCTVCMETEEILLHLFWNCNLVQHFWLAVKNFLMICGHYFSIKCKGNNSWNIRELH